MQLPQNSRGGTVPRLLLPALLAILTSSICWWIALNRFVARDEGYFLYAAKLLLEGKLLYRDFFFPQPPLLPYLFAGIMGVFGTTWYVARTLCAVLTAASIFATVLVTARHYGNRAAMIAWVFCCSSAGILVWFATSQAYAFSTALCMLGLLLIRENRYFFWAGSAIGVAILARFTFAPVALIGLIACWFSNTQFRNRNIALYIFGGLASILVILPAVFPDPHNFFWHAFQYHAERTELSEDQTASKRLHVFLVLLGIHTEAGLGGFQSLCIIGGGTVALAYLYLRHRTLDLFAVCGVALVIAHLCPAPTYVKYFSVVLPFFVPILSYFILQVSKFNIGILRWGIPVLAVLGFGLLGVDNFVRFTQTGDDVIGVGAVNREAWRISAVSEISAMLERDLPPKSIVYTNWPGYLLESSMIALDGTQNHFGRAWADQNRIDTKNRRRLKIRNRQEIVRSFAKAELAGALLFIGRGRTNHPTEIDLKKVGGTVRDERFYVRLYRPPTLPGSHRE